MRVLLFILFVVFLLPGAVHAQQDAITIDLAEDRVDITTGFNGAKLILFGVQEQKGKIAIVFTGPHRKAIVRKKKQVGGVWINRHGMVFENVPTYYDYAVAGEEKDLALPEVLKEQGIGPAALLFDPVKSSSIAETRDFQQALIRNKAEIGLFHVKPEKIVYLDDGKFFKTTFYIPPNVPTGDYQIKAFLFRNGKVQEIKTMGVRVAQVGTSANIYKFSQAHSLLYGLLCVAMAVSIGWFSSLVRRS